MKITVNPTLDMATLRWVGHDGEYEYRGPLVRFGGPSAQETANANAQLAFNQQLIGEQATVFGEDQAVMSQIRSVAEPILARGPFQYGFSPEEDAALRATIETGASEAEANAINAERLRQTQLSGGANVLPSGAQAQLDQQAITLGEQNRAKLLAQEKLSGYRQGAQLYQNALNSLLGVGSNYNPVGVAGATAREGEAATRAASLTENNFWSNLLSSAISGAAQVGAAYVGQGGGG